MNLHDRVMEILDGRIKMGAGAKPKRKPRKPKKKPQKVLNKVPPMYEVPNSAKGQLTTPLASQYVGQNPKITDEMLAHHYPTHAENLSTDPQDPNVMRLLQDMVQAQKGAGVQIAGRQVSKNKGGVIKCRKGCKHIRCKAVRNGKTSVSAGVKAGKKKAGKKYPYEGRMRDHRWTDFVKKFAKLNNMTYKEAMSAAAPYYKDRSPLDKQPPKAKHIGNKKKGAAKPKKAKRVHRKSEWVDYVKEFAKLNNISYKEALKQAGPSYHAQA